MKEATTQMNMATFEIGTTLPPIRKIREKEEDTNSLSVSKVETIA